MVQTDQLCQARRREADAIAYDQLLDVDRHHLMIILIMMTMIIRMTMIILMTVMIMMTSVSRFGTSCSS